MHPHAGGAHATTNGLPFCGQWRRRKTNTRCTVRFSGAHTPCPKVVSPVTTLSPMDSGTVTAWAGLLTALATLVLAGVSRVQLVSLRRTVDEEAKARSVSVMLMVSRAMIEQRPKRRQVLGLPKDWRLWTDDQRTVADEVGTELQEIAFLCWSGLVEPAYVMENYAPVFVNVWERLAGFVEEYRRQTNTPRQRKHLQTFASSCKEYLQAEQWTFGSNT
jgi:hypothetical protein